MCLLTIEIPLLVFILELKYLISSTFNLDLPSSIKELNLVNSKVS